MVEDTQIQDTTTESIKPVTRLVSELADLTAVEKPGYRDQATQMWNDVVSQYTKERKRGNNLSYLQMRGKNGRPKNVNLLGNKETANRFFVVADNLLYGKRSDARVMVARNGRNQEVGYETIYKQR